MMYCICVCVYVCVCVCVCVCVLWCEVKVDQLYDFKSLEYIHDILLRQCIVACAVSCSIRLCSDQSVYGMCLITLCVEHDRVFLA